MKNLILILAIALTSCKKTEVKPTVQEPDPISSPTPLQKGYAIFYYDGGIAAPQITVSINGQTGQITTFSTTVPPCGAAGCATFTLPVGSYTWSASSPISQWNGSIAIGLQGCSNKLLQ